MGHTTTAGRISRRTVLRGLGVAMGLPLLEAMGPLAAVQAAGLGGKAPVRMAVLYMPNGVHPKAWTPAARGSAFELSEVLTPLANVRQDILVLTELMNQASIQGDGHYVKIAPFLTGTAVTRTTGSDLRVGGISMDQLVAQRVGNMTPLPSLELSVEAVTTGVDVNVGFTRIYGSHISWSSPTTPVSRETNPQLAFDRLFRSGGKPAGGVRDASVLDAVREDAKRLRGAVGQADRLKLEEYFEAVRAVETRIAFDAARRKQEVLADPLARREVEKLGDRIRDYYAADPARVSERGIDHTEQVRLMLDIIVLAFWTDSTRVSTFLFGNEVSGKNFSFLPGVSGGHHQISHHENDIAKMEEYKQINIWHMQQLAYMLERMKNIREGEGGTLLDNSMVLFGSGMRDGNAHSPQNLPLVLAGRGGGTLATGRHLVYAPKTPLCNLYRSMMTRMGVRVDRFGDSTGELPGLSDPAFAGVAAA